MISIVVTNNANANFRTYDNCGIIACFAIYFHIPHQHYLCSSFIMVQGSNNYYSYSKNDTMIIKQLFSLSEALIDIFFHATKYNCCGKSVRNKCWGQ